MNKTWAKDLKRHLTKEDKHKIKCPTSYITREMHIKTWIDTGNYTPLKWPKSGTLTIPNAGKDVEQQELSVIAGENVE